MSKLWNGKLRKITIIPRGLNSGSWSFIADDATNISPVNVFFRDGIEVGRYDERTHYFRSDEILEDEEQSV